MEGDSSKTRPALRWPCPDGEVCVYLPPTANRLLTSFRRGAYTCTSNGALRLTPLKQDGEQDPMVASLPTRLYDWRLSSDHQTLAYGGDEVDLSIWSTEAAFTTSREASKETTPAPKKRKRNDALFPGELWRAKNVRGLLSGSVGPACCTYGNVLS